MSFKYSSVYMLIPNSLSIPPLHPSLLVIKIYSLSLWVCFYFTDKFICIIIIILVSTYKLLIIWYLSFSVWLTSLNMIVTSSIHVAEISIISSFFYVWVIFHCIYVPHHLYPFIKTIYRFSAIPIKLPMVFFTEQKNLNICETPNSQSYLEKEKQSWRNQVPWLQTKPQSCSDQNSVVLVLKEWNIDQWNGIESLERNPCCYRQLICNKEGKTIQCRKDSLFNKQCWETGQLHVKEGNQNILIVTPHTKINSNWMRDLNVRLDTMNSLLLILLIASFFLLTINIV